MGIADAGFRELTSNKEVKSVSGLSGLKIRFIDFDLHCYAYGTDGSNSPDTFCLPNGVTTCIDAGSSGSAISEASI